MLSRITVVLNHKLNKRITEIGNRVAKASDKPEIKYTFRIINDSTINAYGADGGFVYINTGLLDVLESEDELAAILGHEIAHISKSHQINSLRSAHQKQMARNLVTRVAVSVAAQAAAQSVPSAPAPYGNTARQQLAGIAGFCFPYCRKIMLVYIS